MQRHGNETALGWQGRPGVADAWLRLPSDAEVLRVQGRSTSYLMFILSFNTTLPSSFLFQSSKISKYSGIFIFSNIDH